jgi:hypothetical protein
MVDVEPDCPSDDDSPEMKTVNKGCDHQLAGSKPGHLRVPSGDPAKAAESMLQNGYTVLVCDETMLLQNLDVFELLVQRRWQIVVPNQVVTYLSALSKAAQPSSIAAQKALNSVHNAYVSDSCLRVITAGGDDTTKHHFAPERPNTPTANSAEEPSNADEQEINLIGVTRRATDMNDFGNGKPTKATEETRSAVLLTDNRLTRVRAAGARVAALAPSVLRKMLSNAGSRIRSLSQSSRTSDQASLGGKSDHDQMET